jgi:glucokinase
MGVLAVDLGGSNLRTGWCKTPQQWYAPTSIAWRARGFPLHIDMLIALLEEQVERCQAEYGEVEAIGLAIAAVIDTKSGVVKVGENLGWQDIPLRTLLEERLQRPVSVDVDAFCGALAEARLGSGADQEHFLYIVMGTGIGHGLILNRQIWHGMHAAANVFGHLKVGSSPTLCYCGGQNCLCQYASGSGLARLALLQGQSVDTGAVEVVRAYQRGETWAAVVVDQMYETLALSISHALNLLDIECVVLGGGVVQSDFPDLAILRQRLEPLVYPEIRPILLRRAALGSDAVLTGAAFLALDQINRESE